jgi:hypothetical protein
MSVYILDANGKTRRGVSGRDADAYLARMKAGEARHLNTIGITLTKISQRTYEFAYQNMPYHPGRISRRDARSIVLDYLRRENFLQHQEEN